MLARARMEALLERIPAGGPSEGAEVCKELLAGGQQELAALVGMTGGVFGDPDGVKPKYAVHALACYAARPGAPKERALVAETLARELGGKHTDELKAFVMRQLQLCGRAEEVPAVAAHLQSDRLCEPATQALLAIGGEEAVEALRSVLSAVAGTRRVTIIKALGRVRDKPSAGAIRTAARESEASVRLTAMYALANMGDGASADLLLAAAEAEQSSERDAATAAALLLGRRLGEAGDRDGAGKIFRSLLEHHERTRDFHNMAAALRGLAEALGADATETVADAMYSVHLWYKTAAARVAIDLAHSIRGDQPAAAEKLARKIIEKADEEAVVQQARRLLAADEGGQT